MDRKEIVQKYLGVPYLNMGRDLKGLDCYGIIMCIYKDLGFDLIDLNVDYDSRWSLKGADYFADNYSKQWQAVDKPKFLDVILFKSGKGIYNHAGVYLGKGDFIHTCKA